MWGNFYAQQFRLLDTTATSEVVVLYAPAEPDWLGHLIVTECRTKKSMTITNAHLAPDLTTSDSWTAVENFLQSFTNQPAWTNPNTMALALPFIANEFRKAVFDHRFEWPQPVPKFCETFNIKSFREQLIKH